jgi:NAD(P)-dependent dehydrogenase (short-subunit alcohol dehydrogenase family)
VVLAARNVADLNAAVNDIREAGGNAIAVSTDVADAVQVQELARRAAETYGRIDTCVNHAGIMLYALFEDTSLEGFRRIMDVNFMGQVHGALTALPHLKRSGVRWCASAAWKRTAACRISRRPPRRSTR